MIGAIQPMKTKINMYNSVALEERFKVWKNKLLLPQLWTILYNNKL